MLCAIKFNRLWTALIDSIYNNLNDEGGMLVPPPSYQLVIDNAGDFARDNAGSYAIVKIP